MATFVFGLMLQAAAVKTMMLQPVPFRALAAGGRAAARMVEVEPQPVRTPIDQGSCALIVGASRGLGLEFAAQFAARGATCFATYRGDDVPPGLAACADAHPGRFHALPLDVSDDASVAAAMRRIQKLAKSERPLSHVVHNAGVYGPVKGLGKLEREALLRTFEVNAVGPLLLAQQAKQLLRPPTARGPSAVYALLSSKMGSVDDNGSGGSYPYRMSKSALVIASKSLSIDLQGQAGGARTAAPLLHTLRVAPLSHTPCARPQLSASIRAMCGRT
jgi:NAD(P)-dependent dehydrogenase (short-subunit alcohol dehydrogenase family)